MPYSTPLKVSHSPWTGRLHKPFLEAELCGARGPEQVVSKKAEKTVIVAVEQLKTHRIYGKRMRQTHRFQACPVPHPHCIPPHLPVGALYASGLSALPSCCANGHAVLIICNDAASSTVLSPVQHMKSAYAARHTILMARRASAMSSRSTPADRTAKPSGSWSGRL